MATAMKRKVSVTLDADLVEAIEAEPGESLSSRLNRALRGEIEQQRRHRALASLLDRLAEDEGPLDTPEDAAEIERFKRLLGGS